MNPVVLAESVALVLLLGASALFSLSETAFIGVKRHKVRQAAQTSRRAALVDRMLDDPERILSTVLVGNTIVNITAATVATVIAESIFAEFATVIATVVVTLLVLVACELVPKTIAVKDPLRVAKRVAPFLRAVEAMMGPVVTLAAWTSKALVRAFGVDAKGKAPYITEEEIRILVDVGEAEGEVEPFEKKVIHDLFEFTETPIGTILTPASKVHFIAPGATLAEAARVASKEGRTRILVADGDFDHVLGFVHIKDLLQYKDEDLERLPVTTAMRLAMHVPHSLMASQLLLQMQREHRSLAVVLDDHGGHMGIITAEDLLEELVGEMHDEFDAAREGKARASRPAGKLDRSST